MKRIDVQDLEFRNHSLEQAIHELDRRGNHMTPEDRLRAAACNPALLATDAADYLVHKGLPFRQAHDLIGKVLREAEKQEKPWTGLTLADLQKISPLFEKDFLSFATVQTAIASKNIPGGTSEESVRAAIAQLEQKLNSQEKTS